MIRANSGDVGYCLTASAQNSLDAETETETLFAVHPITLMQRGRDDGPSIEWRQDGTVNALLTPNGGRAGMGVGCVAAPIAIQERAVCENASAGPDGKGYREDGASYTLEARTVPPPVAFDLAQITSATNRTRAAPGLPASTMSSSSRMHVAQPWATRRLTPRECERLQGFPDDFTAIPWRKKPAGQCPDGPRYKALGNSWAVNCAEWIGERIAMVNSIMKVAE